MVREFDFRIYQLLQKSLEADNEKNREIAKPFVLVMVDGYSNTNQPDP